MVHSNEKDKKFFYFPFNVVPIPHILTGVSPSCLKKMKELLHFSISPKKHGITLLLSYKVTWKRPFHVLYKKINFMDNGIFWYWLAWTQKNSQNSIILLSGQMPLKMFHFLRNIPENISPSEKAP